ncbi:MAG: hypothetical protein JNL98_07455 [Bryobacterales bacterium]|nr:hypothetical protein [Bryobacterales bacterium]
MSSKARLVQKFSVIFLATGDKTEVFRSLDEIPEELRQRLTRIARTSQVDTLVIANEEGRDLLQSQSLAPPQPAPPNSPMISPALRWAIVFLLAGSVGLILNWILHFR